MRKLNGVVLISFLILVGSLAVAGCGGSDGKPDNSVTDVDTGPSRQGTATDAGDRSESEKSTTVVQDLHFLGPEGKSQGSREVCGLLSVEELEELMPVSKERYGQLVHITARPKPSTSPVGDEQRGCDYVDQFEKIWLSVGFVNFDNSVEGFVSAEEKNGLTAVGAGRHRRSARLLHAGNQQPRLHAQMLLQAEGGWVFALNPYNTAGAPGVSEPNPSEGAAPPWVQEVSEELAAAILT